MDIVERLRGKKERVEIPCPDNIKGCAVLHFRLEVNPDCADAAAEIERLRKANKRLGEIATDMVGWISPASVNGPREEYQNEIKELTDGHP